MPVTVEDIDVTDKTVIYRTDYNVPVSHNAIISDFRIKATLPTLDLLLKNNAKVVIVSYLGKPEGKFDPKYSLRPVAEHLLTFFDKIKIQVTDGITGPEIMSTVSNMPPKSILVLGNTRFFPGEEKGDFAFARSIAELGEVYVTDAFGHMHRDYASITQVPKLLDSYPGLLLAKELKELSRLRDRPFHPFCALIGGAKLKDKVVLVKEMLKKADYVLVGGAVANTFAKALGEDVGMSYVEDDMLETARSIAAEANGKLILPVDYVNEGRGEKFRYVDIGSKTVALYKQYIDGSKDLFWNGTMGIAEEARFANGSLNIAQALVNANGLATLAGGDTVSFVEQQGLTERFAFVSTGGGAATAFIAGESLPGLAAININY